MAQFKLAKSASWSSAVLTTLLCASPSAKQQSQEGCQVLCIRTVIWRESAHEKEHFWSENSSDRCEELQRRISISGFLFTDACTNQLTWINSPWFTRGCHGAIKSQGQPEPHSHSSFTSTTHTFMQESLRAEELPHNRLSTEALLMASGPDLLSCGSGWDHTWGKPCKGGSWIPVREWIQQKTVQEPSEGGFVVWRD